MATSPAVALIRAGSAFALGGAAIAVMNLVRTPLLRRGSATIDEPVAVLIPARNEAEHLRGLLPDLTASERLTNASITVLDDGSTDRTAEVAAVAGVHVVNDDGGVPHGWLGKSAACHRLAQSHTAGVLVFVDADVRLDSHAIADAIAVLRATGATLVAVWPEQIAESAAEQLFQPLLAWSWASTLPIAWANASSRPSTAVACGQFLVFDAARYHRFGGHAAVASEVIEDLAIARVARRAGGRTVLVSGTGRVRCRMYTDTEDLIDGYARWLWAAYGGAAGSVAVGAVLSAAYVLPPLAALFGHGARATGVLGWAAAVVSRLAAQRISSGRRPTAREALVAVGHPVSIAAYVGLSALSHSRHARGHLTWKGRRL